MSLKRLSANAVKRILDALHPRFLGRDQDHLVALADEAADDVFTQTQTYVQPLYDFRNDIESTIGASLVGVNDAGSYYIGGNVEAVLQELPSKFIGVGSTVPWTLVSGKPTTLGGYGITDAAPLSHVGAGGTSHANVVAGGAAGFMTGADKTKLDGIATGATANTGTVTSVAVANATGITWTGSPITTSGTLTPALSANLQAWSGIAPSTKADDSAVVHNTGSETVAGAKTFTNPVTVSGTFASNPINVTGSFSGAGRNVAFTNTDTSTSNAVALSLASGATSSGGLTQFGAEYTGIASLAGRLVLENVNGGGVTYSAINASGTHVFTNGSGRTVLATIASDGSLAATSKVTAGGIELGYRSYPAQTQNANYTFVVGDKGTLVAHTSTTANTYTVPANVFALGDVLTIVHSGASSNVTLAQGASMSLLLANSTGAAGNRTLAPRGVATIIFLSATSAIVGGPGVT